LTPSSFPLVLPNKKGDETKQNRAVTALFCFLHRLSLALGDRSEINIQLLS